jgi:hypothetical protein
MPQSRATDQPSLLKLGGPAQAHPAPAPAPAATPRSAAPAVAEASDLDRKSVVRELKEIVKLLGTPHPRKD